MKLYQRYLYVFLCVLLLSIGFSTIVSADDTTLSNLKIDISTKIYQNEVLIYTPSELNITVYPNNNIIEKGQKLLGVSPNPFSSGYEYIVRTTWTVTNKNGNMLFKGGKAINLTLDNGYYNIGYEIVTSGSQVSQTYVKPKYNRALVFYVDGSTEYFDISGSIGNPTTLYLDFTPSKDVNKIEFQLNSSKLDFTDKSNSYGFWGEVGEFRSDKSFQITIHSESEEAGLLSGIIGWIKNIYDTIVNLPSKIWEFISEGLKGLFVPSEDSLSEFKSKMDALLENKLGAIYQVVNILVEGWDEINASDTTNSILLPEVSISLPENNTFTFGGQSVEIVPEGFDFLATACKTAVGIIFTGYFVNGLRKRYDDIMGG